MTHKPVTRRPVIATLTTSLRGLMVLLCLLLVSGSGWGRVVVDPYDPGGGDIYVPDDTPTTLDERNDEALRAAAEAAAQAILNNPGNTPSAQDQAAANLNAAVDPNAIINDKNPRCNQPLAAAYDEAQQKALTVQLAQDNKYFQYAIAGAYAAGCVNDLIKQAEKLGQGVSSLYAVVTAGKPLQAAITLVANQILQAVFRQLVANLENQICSITNQITSFSESFLQNAVCLPSGSLQLGNLFNFNPNLNLNLPNLQCDGLAINPLSLAEIDPQTGQPYAVAQGNYTSGLLAGNGGTGNYSGGVASSLSPVRGFGMDFLDEPVYGYGDDSTNISGTPNNSFEQADAGLGNTSLGSDYNGGAVTCGKGNYDKFLNDLGARESKGCKPSQYACVNSYRFLGKYQMGEAALKDAGVLISCGGSCFDGNNYSGAVWSAAYGGSLQGFLNSATAQEAAAREYRKVQWKYLVNNGLTKYIGQTVQGVKITASGLLAAAQLIGAGGASCGKSKQPCGLWAALKGYTSGTDAYGTSWKEYATKFGGYDTPFAACQ